jgi:hypothetical protein
MVSVEGMSSLQKLKVSLIELLHNLFKQHPNSHL